MLGKRKPGGLNRHLIGMNAAVYGLWAAGATEYFVREIAIDSGLAKAQLIAYSFMISVPFALEITISIIYHQRRYLRKQT